MPNSKNIIINWVILQNYNMIMEYNFIVGFYGMYKYKRYLSLNIEPHQSIFYGEPEKPVSLNFIRSFGNDAKTDILDAKALALYGSERKYKL
jgi:hypothetical protein